MMIFKTFLFFHEVDYLWICINEVKVILNYYQNMDLINLYLKVKKQLKLK